MFGFLDAGKHVEFGTYLAKLFKESIIPSEVAKIGTDRQASKRLDVAVDRLRKRTEDFFTENPGNIYTRAKTLEAFKKSLLDSKYEKNIVDKLAIDLAKHFKPEKNK